MGLGLLRNLEIWGVENSDDTVSYRNGMRSRRLVELALVETRAIVFFSPPGWY